MAYTIDGNLNGPVENRQVCLQHCKLITKYKLPIYELSWKLSDLDNAAGLACKTGEVSAT